MTLREAMTTCQQGMFAVLVRFALFLLSNLYIYMMAMIIIMMMIMIIIFCCFLYEMSQHNMLP